MPKSPLPQGKKKHNTERPKKLFITEAKLQATGKPTIIHLHMQKVLFSPPKIIFLVSSSAMLCKNHQCCSHPFL